VRAETRGCVLKGSVCVYVYLNGALICLGHRRGSGSAPPLSSCGGVRCIRLGLLSVRLGCLELGSQLDDFALGSIVFRLFVHPEESPKHLSALSGGLGLTPFTIV
jgi:hypothetical protein